MKQFLVIVCFLFSSSLLINAQNSDKDAILFSVEGNPVTVSEFDYIYSKTNRDKADYSRQSLEEYLDLYVKFKLKVQKARDLQLDTIPSLQKELEGYRRQLADAYLIDRTVTDKLVREAYERVQEDVDISHILISLAPDATPEDTLAAYSRAAATKRRIQGGSSFEELAKEISDDPSAKRNGGRIGYVTALFPKGLYQLETAAYNGAVNEVIGPVRTQAGYHVLLVHQRRPARGEMEAAHILIRVEEGEEEEAKARIDSLHALLKKGVDFNQLATENSEDRQTANQGGSIGFFGINRYEPSFEDAAFALKEDGDISEVVQSKVGYHIIKRISRKGIQPFAVEKGRLEAKVSQDPRFEMAKEAMLDRIMQENNFKDDRKVLESFAAMQNDTFLTFRWKAPAAPSKELLFSMDDFEVSLGDFTDWLARASRKRLRMGTEIGVKEAVYSLYDDFVKEKLLEFEEAHLEERYPEFKSLMREYREGILLFEATKMLVWDKAGQDTLGLREFYSKVKGKYRWGDRVRTSIYEVHRKHQDMINDIRAYAESHTAEEVLKQFNSQDNQLVSVKELTFEKNRNVPPAMSKAKWEVGSMSANEMTRTNTIKFHKFEELLPPEIRSLEEARGYVVADYQDFLEKEWVTQLEEEYKVKINQKVFESLIKE